MKFPKKAFICCNKPAFLKQRSRGQQFDLGVLKKASGE
jgi:hypothetical protein